MKKTATLFLLLFCKYLLYSQVLPICGSGSPVGMAGDRPPGCLMCSPVYSGGSLGFSAVGPNHPCGTTDNNQFLVVVADANGAISATVLPTFCANDQGMEILILSLRPQAVLDCFSPPGTSPAIPGTVSATGLVPGEAYGIMLDGYNGDECNFVLSVSGAAYLAPPPPPAMITMTPDIELCPGARVCFSIDPQPEAITYDWSIPSNARILSGGGPDDLEVCVEITGGGGGVVRVASVNPCHVGVPAVLPIVSQIIPPTIKPPQTVCLSELPVLIDGFWFDRIGANNAVYNTPRGCDSTVIYTLLPTDQNPNIIDTTICKGDSVLIGPDYYKDMAVYNIEFTDVPYNQTNGCDSLITLFIRHLDPQADIQSPPRIPCDPAATIQIDGSNSTTGTNVVYDWRAYNGGTIVSGDDTNIVTVGSPGNYILNVTESNENGTIFCSAEDTVLVVIEPQVLDSPTFINPDLSVCPNTMNTYSINPITDANDYLWTNLNGDTIAGVGTSLPISFVNTGGQICVEGIGVCGNSIQECINVVVNATPSADFTVQSPICDNGTSNIQYNGSASPAANYTWNFNGGTPTAVTGPGPHAVSWASAGIKTITLTVEENGCVSTQATQTIQVDEPLAAPVINCSPDLSSVTFSWPDVIGATSYDVVINGGAPINQVANSITVPGLNPGDNVTITVTVNGNSACGTSMASSSCIVQNCPPVSIVIDPVSDICKGMPQMIQLNATPSGGVGGGTFNWSGTGVNTMGLFDSDNANVGTNVISVEYREGSCVYTQSTNIVVNASPNSLFTVDSPICETETSTITYTGSASAAATFNWNFGTGTIVSGTGIGPYEIRWPNGNQNVTLSVVENGCTSTMTTQPVVIDAPLPLPIITCLETTSNSVTFIWDEVPGATGYTINGPGVVDLSSRTVTVTGLTQGNVVTIEVVANGNSQCGSSRASFSCTASNCVAVPITIDPIGPFCDDGNNSPIQLSATAGDNTGVFTWSGSGVTGNLFNPDDPSINPGDVTIRVSYEKDNCIDTESILVKINPRPTSGFTVDDPICITDNSTITYTGNASNATFDWNFDGGNPSTANTVGPHQVSWATGGTKTISLVVNEDNCLSEPTRVTVAVDEELVLPMISCSTDQNSITFNWPRDNSVLFYNVNLLSGTAGIFDGLETYTVSNLMPGDMVEIEVVANGDTECGTVSSTLECTAKDCDDFFVTMPDVAPICLYPNTVVFNLNDDPNFTVTDPTGADIKNDISVAWSDGNGGNTYLSLGGQFSPTGAASNVGFGSIPIAVEIEYPRGSGCFTTFTTEIEINEVPTNALVLDRKICESETATVELQIANIFTGADFDWDFGRANAAPGGNSEGPHTLTWTDGGFSDEIKLTITSAEGCISDEMTTTIEIDEELEPTAANLRCNLNNTNNQTIEFNWDDVPGVDDYMVNVLTAGFAPSSTTANAVIFDGLTPGTTLEIELVMSNSNSNCPPVSTTLECSAVDCENPTITFEPIADDCIDPNGASIQLAVQISPDPSNGSGVRTWSGGTHISSSGIFTPTVQGDYPIEFQLEFEGCIYRNTTSIEMYETPVVDFTVDPIICETDAANISFTGSAHPDAVFSWDLDGGSISGNDRDPRTVSWTNDLGNQTISLSIINSGCEDGPVTQMVQVDPEIEPIVIDCNPNLASTTQVGFVWNSDPNVSEYEIFIDYPIGSGFVSQGTQTNNDFLFENVNVGDVRVGIRVVTISDSSCPSQEASGECEAADCPPLTLDVPLLGPVCLGEPAFPINSTINGGNNTGIIQISGPGVVNDIFDSNIAGIGIHTLLFEFSEQGCDYSETREIEVERSPIVEAGDNQILSCTDSLVEIGSMQTETGSSYRWSLNGATIGNQRIINVDQGGNYILQATSSNGCTATDSVFVDASFSNPELIAELEQITCFGESDGVIQLLGLSGSNAPYEYSINGSMFSDRDRLESLGPGNYTIIGRGENGCSDTLVFSIVEPEELYVEILVTDGVNPVPFGDSIQLEATTNANIFDLSSINWSPADQLPICDPTTITNCINLWVTPVGEVVYTVRIENERGCSDKDEITLIGLADYYVYVPTAFSPNNQDRLNDVFGVFGNLEYVKEVKSFLVFNRWGEVVHESRNFQPSTTTQIDPANGWDGTLRGKPLNSGVFAYFVEVEFKDGQTRIFSGDVTLH